MICEGHIIIIPFIRTFYPKVESTFRFCILEAGIIHNLADFFHALFVCRKITFCIPAFCNNLLEERRTVYKTKNACTENCSCNKISFFRTGRIYTNITYTLTWNTEIFCKGSCNYRIFIFIKNCSNFLSVSNIAVRFITNQIWITACFCTELFKHICKCNQISFIINTTTWIVR